MGVLFLLFAALLAVDVVTAGGSLFRGTVPALRGWAVAGALVLSVVALVQGLREPVVRDYEVSACRAAGRARRHRAGRDLGHPPRHPHRRALDGPPRGSRQRDEAGPGRRGRRPRGRQRPRGRAVCCLSSRACAPRSGSGRSPATMSGTPGSTAACDSSRTRATASCVTAGPRPLPASCWPAWTTSPDGASSARADHPVEKALAGRPSGATVLLSHSPLKADEAAAAGAGLMLSGHTHDGQIWPFRYLVRFAYPLARRALRGRWDVGDRLPRDRHMGPAHAALAPLRDRPDHAQAARGQGLREQARSLRRSSCSGPDSPEVSSCFSAAVTDHQKGDVVVGLTTGAVLGGGVEERPPDGLGVPAPKAGQRALDTLDAELLALRRERLGDAVAVEDNRVAGRQLDVGDRPTWPSAAARGPGPGAARARPSRWPARPPAGSGRRSRGSGSRRLRSRPMPRVRNRFPGLCLSEAPVERGHQRVDGLAELVQEADEPLRHRHDQRRRDPLARHVPECHRQDAVVAQDAVVEVASDAARRLREGEDLARTACPAA